MTVRRLSAVDAQTYWMSAKIPNDTVLLYGFAGVPADPEAAIEEIVGRARGCPDLTMRVDDGGPLTYPAWVHRDVDRSSVRACTKARTFQACLDQVGEITADRLDARVAAWRLHVFTGVEGVPGAAGRARWRCCRSHMRLAAAGEPRRPPRSCSADAKASSRESTPPAHGRSDCRSWAFAPRVRIARWSKTPTQEGPAAGRSAPGAADQCAAGGTATPSDGGGPAFRPAWPHRDGRCAVGGFRRAR